MIMTDVATVDRRRGAPACAPGRPPARSPGRPAPTPPGDGFNLRLNMARRQRRPLAYAGKPAWWPGE